MASRPPGGVGDTGGAPAAPTSGGYPGSGSGGLEVIRPGSQTLVVDAGRWGYQRFGVPPTGAFDRLALVCANVLVGNAPDAAALEFTFGGPRLRSERDLVGCLAGGPFEATLAGAPVPTGRPFVIPAGSELAIGRSAAGLRGILALSGGLAVPPVLGSRSTDLRGRFGGCQGRPLAEGDRVPVGGMRWADLASMERWAARAGECAPGLADLLGEDASRVAARTGAGEERSGGPGQATTVLRAIRGPQAKRFQPRALATLFSRPYRVRADSDRMGVRLEGPTLEHAGPPDIASDATVPGTIQVPAGGQPIVLGVDGQTTGGYPKPATVIGPDLGRLAQVRPGEWVAFTELSAAEGVALARRRAALLEGWRRDVEAWANPAADAFRFLLAVRDREYRVTVAPADGPGPPDGETGDGEPPGRAPHR